MSLLISIIIPVYNVAPYLHQCLDSIFEQEADNYEVICINDGSTDGSAAILDEYAAKYPNLKVQHVANGGTAKARNLGMELAQGEYIWFVDSDDWIQPGAILALINWMERKRPDVLNFSGSLYIENTNNIESDELFNEELLTGWEYYNKYALVGRKFHFVCVVLRLYKTEFIRSHNLWFDTTVTHEDNLWIPQVMYYAQSVYSIPENLYMYRIRQGSKMQTQNPQRIFDIVSVANKLAAFFIPLSDIDKRTVYREIAGEYFKGFMPVDRQIYGKNDRELMRKINWESYRTVSLYPRHRRIYGLLRVHPALFRLYIRLEHLLKSKL